MLTRRPRTGQMPTIVVILSLFLLCFCSSSFAWAEDLPEPLWPEKTLTVSGEGKVEVAPDIAYINLGVVTEDPDARVAQQRNSEQMSRIIAQLKGAGIPPEDIRTVSFNIYQRYRHDRDTRESSVEGYTVNNSVRITVRDVKRAGDAIDIASRHGMNISGGIQFDLSDRETHYRRALKEAGTVASGRAQALAESMGVDLKGPVSITERKGFEPVPRPMRAVTGMAESHSTPVESGTVTVEANVTVVYDF